MNGGDGNDTYIVDNDRDVVKESVDDTLGGTADTVLSSVTYSLAPGTAGLQGFGIENLTLTGSANISATGNAKNNVINGNSGANTLDGGAGDDTMNGGDGNDTYIVDNVGDVAKESFDDTLGGTADTVSSSVTYSLAPGTAGLQGFGIENLTLTGSANISATGNAKNNVINGNGGANTLDGGAGNDTLDGGAGNDTVNGGAGADTLIGGGGVDKLIGGAGADTLNGGAANDILNGGAGADTLNGGAGADKFNFTAPPPNGKDSIIGFSAVDDSIGLNAQAGEEFATGLVFDGGVGSALSAASYFEGAGANGNGAQQSGIFVDTSSGNLWYNPTSGIAGDSILFASVDAATSPTMSQADFVLL